MTTKKLFAFAALAAITSVSATAGTISFNATVPTSSSPFTDTFSLNNFNTSLGTLTGITISFAYTTTGVVDVNNTTSSAQPFSNATSSIPLTLDADFSVTGLTTTANAVAGPLSGTAPAMAITAFPGAAGSGTLSITVPTADFADFEIPPSGSTDSYSVSAASGTFGGTAASGVFFGGSATAGGTATITYAYNTVSNGTPEPATMALMGSALLGLGLFGRRLKKS